MKQYDVVIVGAGPAGGQLARELSEKGYDVLVINKEMEIGEPIYSSALVPAELMTDFKLPSKIACRSARSISIFGPTESISTKFNRTVIYTINFKRLKKYLLHEAIKKGAKTIIGTTVHSPILKGGKIIGVKYTGFEGNGEAYGKVVVDASGPDGIIASQLGLRKIKEKGFSIALEFLMENLKLEGSGNRMNLYAGSQFIPSGYAWILPTKRDELRWELVGCLIP